MPAELAEETRVETRFGTFVVSGPQIITFPTGLPGFEQCRRFVVIDTPELRPLRCLQGLDAPAPSFLVVDPTLVDPDFPFVLPPAGASAIGATAGDVLVWFTIVTVNAAPSPSTANMRAPLVIDARSMTGAQVMYDDERYAIAQPVGG